MSSNGTPKTANPGELRANVVEVKDGNMTGTGTQSFECTSKQYKTGALYYIIHILTMVCKDTFFCYECRGTGRIADIGSHIASNHRSSGDANNQLCPICVCSAGTSTTTVSSHRAGSKHKSVQIRHEQDVCITCLCAFNATHTCPRTTATTLWNMMKEALSGKTVTAPVVKTKQSTDTSNLKSTKGKQQQTKQPTTGPCNPPKKETNTSTNFDILSLLKTMLLLNCSQAEDKTVICSPLMCAKHVPHGMEKYITSVKTDKPCHCCKRMSQLYKDSSYPVSEATCCLTLPKIDMQPPVQKPVQKPEPLPLLIKATDIEKTLKGKMYLQSCYKTVRMIGATVYLAHNSAPLECEPGQTTDDLIVVHEPQYEVIPEEPITHEEPSTSFGATQLPKEEHIEDDQYSDAHGTGQDEQGQEEQELLDSFKVPHTEETDISETANEQDFLSPVEEEETEAFPAFVQKQIPTDTEPESKPESESEESDDEEEEDDEGEDVLSEQSDVATDEPKVVQDSLEQEKVRPSTKSIWGNWSGNPLSYLGFIGKTVDKE